MKKIIFLVFFFGYLASGLANYQDGLYLRSLSVSVDPKIPGPFGTAVSVFFLYDQKLMQALPNRSPEWFAIEQSLKQEESNAIDILSFSLEAGEVLQNIPLPPRSSRAIAMGVFVRHATDPQSTLRMYNLHLNRDPVIFVGEHGFIVKEDPSFKKKFIARQCARMYSLPR